MSRRYYKVTGRVAKTYTEEEIEATPRWGLTPRERRLAIEIDRRDFLGKTFIFEQLECGHLGDCIGIAGTGSLKDPATKRICEAHDDDEE